MPLALVMNSEYTWWIPWTVGIAVGFFFFYIRPRRKRHH
jgi:hypothetical protein